MPASFRSVLLADMEKGGIKCFTVNTPFLEAIFQWEGNVENISDLNSLQISCSDKRVFLDIKKDYQQSLWQMRHLCSEFLAVH